ncbi:MAG: hypothetical protein ACLPZF_16645 [Candidatus Acidiferrales bacterium]
MRVSRGSLTAVCVFTVWLAACSKTATTGTTPTNADSGAAGQNSAGDSKTSFAPLLNRIWRVSNASYGPASGAIYIFLSNGTLLETSCVETYRIAVWSVDKAQPDTLRVVEDQQQVFTATIGKASGATLHLHQKMIRSAETRDVTLTAVDGEFVCPDQPR